MQTPTFDDRPIWDVWLSVYQMPTLVVADEIDLFVTLAEHPLSADELAEGLKLNLPALKAFLPMLTSLGFLTVRLGRYQLTGPARLYLLKQSPLYWGHAFSIHRANSWVGRLTAALKADSTQPQDLFNEENRPVDGWESGQLDPEMARNICAFMHSHSVPAAIGLAGSARFKGTRRLLDVGGGSGCFSIALAERWPQLSCTVMELPVMCELAQPYIDGSDASDRVQTQAVDMFRQAWPSGHDAIFMSNVLHDWDEPTCAKLLASSFAALPSGGHVHLHEMLLADDGSGPLSAASFAMLMLVGTKGRQYSAVELSRLLKGAGFVDVAIDQAYGHFSLVTGRKP